MKKILLVYDQDGWAFHFHCIEIKKRLSAEYYFDMVDHRKNIPDISRDFDIVYVMDPMPLFYGYPPRMKTIMGLRNEFLFREHPGGAELLYKNGFNGRCAAIEPNCCILHMVNKHQMNVFKGIVLDRPLILCQHGIDENIFDAKKYIKNPNGVLTVGVSGRDSENKGFSWVKIACDKLGLRFVVAQYGGNKIPKEKMPECFYNKIDVYVCFSKSEGLHNPSLEAGAMAIPLVSTRCGAAEEIINDGKSGLLIDRNIESLVIALDKLRDDKTRSSMGTELYQEIMRKWSWREKINDYRKMFDRFFTT